MLVSSTRNPAAFNNALLQASHSGAVEADIEELCLVCESIPPAEDNGSVTIYPMKAIRKKAREELDSVNVIEWRSKNKQERWFLLVRRPEGGELVPGQRYTPPDSVWAQDF